MKTFAIALLPGDGIGKEIVPPCLDLLSDAAAITGGFSLAGTTVEAGAEYYKKTGKDFDDGHYPTIDNADAILLGAMGLPDIRYPDGREIAPHLDLRDRYQLFAGIRPIKSYPGIPSVLSSPRQAEIDFIIVRESTEGLYLSRSKGVVEHEQARDELLLTRKGCERLFDFSFRLARRRNAQTGKNLLTCVDKANVLRSYKFFRDVFDEKAKEYADVGTNYCYVDAMAMNMVKRPWEYDVMVMENMFGDILSDLGAGVIGGLGMAPSAEIGEKHAIFQPSHGSAPDIMGQDKANPLAMFLSGALMLDWLAGVHDMPEAAKAAELVNRAVSETLASGSALPIEFGGSAGTRAMTDAVRNTLAAMKV